MATVIVKTPMFQPRDLDRDVTHKVIAPTTGIVKRPHVSTMLETAYNIIHWELRELEASVQKGTPMTLELSKKFEILSRQLASLATEERKQREDDNLHDLSDAELARMAKDAGVKLLGQ